MIKKIIKNIKDLNAFKKEQGYNLEKINREPNKYPCIAILAYAGAGFDEIDFIYKEDFSI